MRHDTIGYTCTPLVMPWVCMVVYSNLAQEATHEFPGAGVHGELAESLNSAPCRAARGGRAKRLSERYSPCSPRRFLCALNLLKRD